MLKQSTKKLIALGMSLSTLAGVMPATISPISVFASENAEGLAPFNYAKGKLDDELNNFKFSSSTKQDDIDTILKDFSYTTTTGSAITIKATTKNDSFSNSKGKCSFTVNLSDESVTKSYNYSYTYDKVTTLKTNLETTMDVSSENQYGTIVTLNIMQLWQKIIIAGVDCSSSWSNELSGMDPNVVVTKLNAANFTGGYKLISAVVEDYVSSDGKTYKKVVVKLGLAEKLSAFPLTIASYNGNPLLSDNNGIHDSGWGINGSMQTYDVKNKSSLITLYNAHIGDKQGYYTDASWAKFTTALNEAKIVIDNTAATQDEVITAMTNLETAIIGLQNQFGTIVTLNITGFWNNMVIAGVDCTTPWPSYDPNVVVTKLNAAKQSNSFTGGYKLISAVVDGTKVVVKLGLAEKLSTFPLTIAISGGASLISDSAGIHDSTWAINGSMQTYDTEIVNVDKSALITLYNAHKGDTKGSYTDTNWSTFTTALNDAKTIIDKTAATQEEVNSAKAKLETAIAKVAVAWSSLEQYSNWTNGGYKLYNDIWGAGSGPQIIWANSYSNWGVWAAHPSTGGIKSYPNSTKEINKQLSSINALTSSFDVTVPTSGTSMETTYDVWLGNGAHEIMLWMNSYGSVAPFSDQYDSSYKPVPYYKNISVGGHTWDVYKGYNGGNMVYSFIRTSGNVSSGTVDIKAIANWIKNTPQWYGDIVLDKVQLGFEISASSNNGNGYNFITNSFSVTSN